MPRTSWLYVERMSRIVRLQMIPRELQSSESELRNRKARRYRSSGGGAAGIGPGVERTPSVRVVVDRVREGRGHGSRETLPRALRPAVHSRSVKALLPPRSPETCRNEQHRVSLKMRALHTVAVPPLSPPAPISPGGPAQRAGPRRIRSASRRHFAASSGSMLWSRALSSAAAAMWRSRASPR